MEDKGIINLNNLTFKAMIINKSPSIVTFILYESKEPLGQLSCRPWIYAGLKKLLCIKEVNRGRKIIKMW